MKTIQQVKHPAPKLKKRLKVAAYARVSVESERMHHSLSAQVSYYSGLIQKNPEWEYAGVYADYGISGTGTAKRDAFNRMLADAEAGKIDLILTKAIQRFARNTVDLLQTVRHLKEIGVEVWFEKENIRTFSNDGELMLTILASFAQEESRSISQNIKWHIQKRFEQGIPNGRFNLYGYRWEGDQLVIVPEEAAVVRRIFQNFLDGKSRLETEREFAAEGITTRQGYRWMDSNIRNVLTNVNYTGNMLLQKEYIEDPISKHRKKNKGELPQYYVEDTHEAVIDKATFDYVQQEMARRRELGPFANKSLNTCCFTGKIKCGICGKSYVHDIRSDRGFSECWTCTSHKTKGRYCNSKGSIPQKVLEKECAAVLGLGAFDEQVFLDKVDKIIVPEYKVMEFHLKDGRVITRHWVSTAKKDCWTDEHKDKQRAWMKRYMASGADSRYSPFTTRIICEQCGAAYRHTAKTLTDGSLSIRWRCPNTKQHFKRPGLEEGELKRITAEVLGIPAFDGAIFRERVDHVSVGEANALTFYLTDGTTVKRACTTKRKGHPWTPKEREARMAGMKRRRERHHAEKSTDHTGDDQPVHSSADQQ